LKTKAIEAIEQLSKLINDYIFLLDSRVSPSDFSRKRKLTFKSTILFMLNFVKKSLTIELDDFFENFEGVDVTITKSSFTEARLKIVPEAFVKMNDTIVDGLYSRDDVKTYRGYRMSAIDGMSLEVNNSEQLREAFGSAANQSTSLARALSSCIYDIENDVIITSIITKCNASERDIAVTLIEQLEKRGFRNDLILFDRGYPSRDLLLYLESKPVKYLMRASSSTFKAVNEACEPDQTVEIAMNGKIVKVRVLKFMLSSGEEEILITNLIDEELTIEDFKELYFKRWGIEVKYNILKNRLQIESFTGDNEIAVKQDFYAAILLSNLVAFAKSDANEIIAEKHQAKNLKYEHQANTNIIIGKLKNNLILMLLDDNPITRNLKFNKIMSVIIRNTVPIRPGLSNKRNMRIKANKYQLNKKRSL